MAENQRGWGQQGHHERYDQPRDEFRRREEDQQHYPGMANRYNSPGYGSVQSWGSTEHRGNIPYGSPPVMPGYGPGQGYGSVWGSHSHTSPGYRGTGYSGTAGSSQPSRRGVDSSGTWGGSSGAVGVSNYGNDEYRRASFDTSYPSHYSQEHTDWPEQRDFGHRGFWGRAKDEASSWFGDEEAERRRELDRRLMEIEESRRDMEEFRQGGYNRNRLNYSYKGKGPKAYKRSDDRIKEDISDRLTDDDRLDASNIEVSVRDAEVTLSGTVDSRESKRRAEDITEMVSGVQHIQNNLRVIREGVNPSKQIYAPMPPSTGNDGK